MSASARATGPAAASRQLANLIGGCWRIPWSGAAFTVGSVRVARSSGLDVTAAIAAAGVAAPVWEERGRGARVARLERAGALIEQRRFEHGFGTYHSGDEPQATLWRAPRRLIDAAWQRVQHVDQRAESRAGVAVDARGVRWLAVPVNAEPLPELARALHVLRRGETLVVALLFDDRHPQGVAVAALWCALARCLPPGVLNVLCGLGLELGVSLVEASGRVARVRPAQRPAAPLQPWPGRSTGPLAVVS
ncbi:hypothetical protein [Marichromatium bheemlicum]|uniref:Aldehyde dehydrogenase family protein n=1 Tax=Marichromatium bheemlicum TaxID=365339 RepID=A0ABX1I5E5_9GAMM|nr:hypothetical protein [Marichromatium bheemlicum]NKN32797.1 hypothetical protein [Marichromatium bheemlicum]